jgi:NAD+--asparagine ADP-ribosyltransferase
MFASLEENLNKPGTFFEVQAGFKVQKQNNRKQIRKKLCIISIRLRKDKIFASLEENSNKQWTFFEVQAGFKVQKQKNRKQIRKKLCII